MRNDVKTTIRLVAYRKCVILADSDALDRVSKAWIPETYNGKKLWYDNGAIEDYIKSDLDKS